MTGSMNSLCIVHVLFSVEWISLNLAPRHFYSLMSFKLCEWEFCSRMIWSTWRNTPHVWNLQVVKIAQLLSKSDTNLFFWKLVSGYFGITKKVKLFQSIYKCYVNEHKHLSRCTYWFHKTKIVLKHLTHWAKGLLVI